MPRLLTVALLVLLLVPAGAAAEPRVIRSGSVDAFAADRAGRPNAVAGPRFAGTSVVWTERRGKEVVSVLSTRGTRRRIVDRTPLGAGRAFALDADTDPDADDARIAVSTGAAFRTGAVTGSLKAIASACALDVELSYGAIGGSCTGQGYRVRESDGTETTFAADTSRSPVGRLEESYVAVRRADGVAVLERAPASGDEEGDGEEEDDADYRRRQAEEDEDEPSPQGPVEVLRVTANIGDFALDSGGRLFYVLRDGGRVAWSSPEEPAVHPFDGLSGVDDLALGGGRIAARRRGPGRTSTFTALTTLGEPLATHTATAAEAGFAFDGNRLAYVRRPCAAAEIRVVDAVVDPEEDEEPEPDSDSDDLRARAAQRTEPAGCALPRPAVKRARLSSKGIVTVPLTCATKAAAACAARVKPSFRLRDARGRRTTRAAKTIVVTRLPGQRTRLELRLPRRDLRAARSAELALKLTGPAGRTKGKRERTDVVALRLPRR